jgi:aconitate hydratase
MELPVLLVVSDDVTTDEILPAGARVLSLWSNLPGMSEHVFGPLDESYVDRARRTADTGGHAVVGGRNYGQGSSREQAALAPRFFGLRLVLAESIARIHAENLVHYGVLPLTFVDPHDREHLDQGTTLRLRGLHQALRSHTAELDVEHDSGTARSSRTCPQPQTGLLFLVSASRKDSPKPDRVIERRQSTTS